MCDGGFCLRFRLYVGGRLAVEYWAGLGHDPELAELGKQAAERLGELAHSRGVGWLFEVHDPDESDPTIRTQRYGTDTAGMVMPVALHTLGPPSMN